jgi:phage N-6-adenine-methyltransferase
MIEHDRVTLAKSEDPNWRTPALLVQALFAEFPLAIDLAACADDAICEEWLGPGSPRLVPDALALEHWAHLIPEYAYGFLNPPYSRKLKLPIEPWIERCWKTARSGRGVVAVLPAAIQTVWWQDFVWDGTYDSTQSLCADEIRFMPHRVSFEHPEGEKSSNANVNTAIVIWRPARPFVGPWTPHVRYWSYR